MRDTGEEACREYDDVSVLIKARSLGTGVSGST